MKSERNKASPIDYATPPERRRRLPSPWLIATLVNNPFFVLGVLVVLTILVIVVRVSVKTLLE